VAGELGERYATAFEGRETISGQTMLTGDVTDGRYLHGILDRVGALGLTLAEES